MRKPRRDNSKWLAKRRVCPRCKTNLKLDLVHSRVPDTWEVFCMKCGFSGPKSESITEAVRLWDAQ